PPNLPTQHQSSTTSGSLAMIANDGLVRVPLVNGDFAWLEGSAALKLKVPDSAPPPKTGPQSAEALNPGAILGKLPVASPFYLGSSQQTIGPAGYIPQQIQTAYGLSTGSTYNNNISFAGIKGDGSGQTIGIFEEGYNP